MDHRLSRRLLHLCRTLLLLGTLLGLGTGAVWVFRPQWIHALDEGLQRDHVRGPEERLGRAVAMLPVDRARAMTQLAELHRELRAVRRGDRLESVAALAHFFWSQALLEDGRPGEAVAAAAAIVDLDPRNVDGLLAHAEARFRAGAQREAMEDLRVLHARVPNEEKVTAALLRLCLETQDAWATAQTVAAFEGAARSNRWTVRYLVRGAPLQDFNLLQEGLLVPRRLPDGRMAASFALEGAVSRVRIILPPGALLRLDEPRLMVGSFGSAVPAEAAVPAPQLTAIDGGFEARGALRGHLDYALGELAEGERHSFEFSARVEPIPSPALSAILADPRVPALMERLRGAGEIEAEARLRRWRLASRGGTPLRLSWRTEGQDFTADQVAEAVPLLVLEPGSHLSFRVAFPVSGPAAHLRLSLPAEPGASVRLTSVTVGRGDTATTLAEGQLSLGPGHDLRIDGSALQILGPEPRTDLTIAPLLGPVTIVIRGELR